MIDCRAFSFSNQVLGLIPLNRKPIYAAKLTETIFTPKSKPDPKARLVFCAPIIKPNVAVGGNRATETITPTLTETISYTLTETLTEDPKPK